MQDSKLVKGSDSWLPLASCGMLTLDGAWSLGGYVALWRVFAICLQVVVPDVFQVSSCLLPPPSFLPGGGRWRRVAEKEHERLGNKEADGAMRHAYK